MNMQAPIRSMLSTRAMLAGVRISSWSGRKLDRSVTEEINHQHQASADAGRYNKALVAPNALAELVTIANEARSEHYAFTLAWHDDGARLLPAKNYAGFMASMRKLRQRHEAAVSTFIAGYSDFVEDARARLNTMFKAGDYPDPHDIAGRFSFDVVLQPVADAGDFRVDVGDEEIARIQADMQARTSAALRDAMAEVYGRVCEKVGHMAAKLAETRPGKGGAALPAIFRDSLVENIRDLVALLPGLNITGDAALEAIAQRMRNELLRFDPDQLREDDGARAETAKAAESIAADAKAAAEAYAHVSDFMA